MGLCIGLTAYHLLKYYLLLTAYCLLLTACCFRLTAYCIARIFSQSRLLVIETCSSSSEESQKRYT